MTSSGHSITAGGRHKLGVTALYEIVYKLVTHLWSILLDRSRLLRLQKKDAQMIFVVSVHELSVHGSYL